MAVRTNPITSLPSGQEMTLDPADNTGHLVRNTDGVILIITTGATATNVTITVNNKNLPASGSFPRVTLTDTVIAVGSNKTFFAGPFPTAYNDANGDLNIAFSAVTNVKIGAVKAGA